MGPDFTVNGYSFDLDSEEFALESILREYGNAESGTPTPQPKAAFESRPLTAELIDEPDEPEEPLGVLEQALAAPVPGPEEPDEPEETPEGAAEDDPFAAYAEDYPDAEAPQQNARRGGLLRGTWRETLGLEEKPDEPEEDVREYHPGEFHDQYVRRGSASKVFSGLRAWVDRMTSEYEDEPAENEEFSPPEPDTPIRPDPPQPVQEPDEPTMVFHAVTDDSDAYAPRSGEEYAEGAEDYEPEPERPDFREAVLQPILTRIAAVAYRMRESRSRAREAAAVDEPLGPEPTPERAAAYYGSRIRSLKLRGRISAFVTLILVYISLGLPVFGLLRSSQTILALTCLSSC